jgi:hypothetical protein
MTVLTEATVEELQQALAKKLAEPKITQSETTSLQLSIEGSNGFVHSLSVSVNDDSNEINMDWTGDSIKLMNRLNQIVNSLKNQNTKLV